MDHLIIFHIIVFYDDFEPISIHFSNDFDFFTSYFSYIYFTYFLSTFFFLFSLYFLIFFFSFSFFPFFFYLSSFHPLHTSKKQSVQQTLLFLKTASCMCGCTKFFYFSRQQVVCVGRVYLISSNTIRTSRIHVVTLICFNIFLQKLLTIMSGHERKRSKEIKKKMR